MDHRRPKLWNGPNALGEALVRGLELTGSPYLTAIAGDVYAGVMDGKGEVKFSGGDIVGFLTTPSDDSALDGWGPRGPEGALGVPGEVPADAIVKVGSTKLSTKRNSAAQAGTCVLWEGPQGLTISANVGVSFRYVPYQYRFNAGNGVVEKDTLNPEADVYLLGQRVAAPGPVIGACVFRGRLTVVVRDSDAVVSIHETGGVVARAKKDADRAAGGTPLERTPTWIFVGSVSAPVGAKFYHPFSFAPDGGKGVCVAHKTTPNTSRPNVHPAQVTSYKVTVNLSRDSEGSTTVTVESAALEGYSLLSLAQTVTGGEPIEPSFEEVRQFCTISLDGSSIVQGPVTEGDHGEELFSPLLSMIDALLAEIDVSWATSVTREPGRMDAVRWEGGQLVRAESYGWRALGRVRERRYTYGYGTPKVYVIRVHGKECLGASWSLTGEEVLVEAVGLPDKLTITQEHVTRSRTQSYIPDAGFGHMDFSILDIPSLVDPELAPHLVVTTDTFSAGLDEGENSETASGTLGYDVRAGDFIIGRYRAEGKGLSYKRLDTYSAVEGGGLSWTYGKPIVQTVTAPCAVNFESQLVVARKTTLTAEAVADSDSTYVKRRFTVEDGVVVQQGAEEVAASRGAGVYDAKTRFQIGPATTGYSAAHTLSFASGVARGRNSLSMDIGVGITPAICSLVAPPPYTSSYYKSFAYERWGTPHPYTHLPDTYPPDNPFTDPWVMEGFGVGYSPAACSKKAALVSSRGADGEYINLAARVIEGVLQEVPVGAAFDWAPQDNFRLAPVRLIK